MSIKVMVFIGYLRTHTAYMQLTTNPPLLLMLLLLLLCVIYVF